MTIKLSSGKEVYTNHGVLGIAPEGHEVDGCILTGGYDSPIWLTEYDNKLNDYIPRFTIDELLELADIAITRWEKFKLDVAYERVETK